MSRQSLQREYVITTSSNGDVISHIWDSSAPIALGHPFHWVLERTQEGVRVRNLLSPEFAIETNAIQEIPAEEIARGADIALPRTRHDSSPEVRIHIREAQPLDLPFLPNQIKSGELQVYVCAGNWILQSVPLADRFTGYAQGTPVFEISKSGQSYQISAKSEGLSVNEQSLSSGQSLSLTSEELAAATLTKGTLEWHFSFVEPQTLPEVSDENILDPESLWFRKAAKICASLLLVFSLAIMLIPSQEKAVQEEEELIPAQYAKIVMNQNSKPASVESGGGPSAAEAPQRAEEAKVVQAFRAKALQSAVSGLLKGGMTNLLAQSDFVNANPNSANRMFNSSNSALDQTSSREVAEVGDRNTRVAALGGGGGTGGVGYGKGHRAGVQGQGQGFVSFDDSSGVVEEGLTKEQVGEVIHRHMSEVRYCYESAILRTPDIEGKLQIAFTIGGNGLVRSAKISSSTLPDPRLDDCVLRRLMSWKFPNPKGGVNVSVSYPFIFKTLGR